MLQSKLRRSSSVVEKPIRNPAVDIVRIWNQWFAFGLFGENRIIRGDLDGFRYSLCTETEFLIGFSPSAERQAIALGNGCGNRCAGRPPKKLLTS